MIILNTSKIMKITVCRKAHFNSAHRLANLSWTKEKNLNVFGKCSYENYHGHNYELIVKLTGEIDPETGMLMDLSILKKIIKFALLGKNDWLITILIILVLSVMIIIMIKKFSIVPLIYNLSG